MLPKQYGARRPLLFPLEWCLGRKKPAAGGGGSGGFGGAAASPAAVAASGVPLPSADSFEPVNLPNVAELDRAGKCVRVARLRKTFR